MDTMKADVTNQRVADDLDITHSAVSRVRSGDRLPSFALMLRIEERIGWDLRDQTDARLLGSYDVAFEKALASNYGE